MNELSVYKQDKQVSVKCVSVTSNIELAKMMEGRGGAVDTLIELLQKTGCRLLEDGFTNAADRHYDTNVSVDQEFIRYSKNGLNQ